MAFELFLFRSMHVSRHARIKATQVVKVQHSKQDRLHLFRRETGFTTQGMF